MTRQYTEERAQDVGYIECTQGAEAIFSRTGSSPAHCLCSGEANPKLEIPQPRSTGAVRVVTLPSTNGSEGHNVLYLKKMFGYYICTLFTTNTFKIAIPGHVGTLFLKVFSGPSHGRSFD